MEACFCGIGLYTRLYIYIWICTDNGKENGSYHLGFRDV